MPDSLSNIVDLAVGDCVFERANPDVSWRVVQLVHPSRGFVHARLRGTDDPAVRKIVSCRELTRTPPGRLGQGKIA